MSREELGRATWALLHTLAAQWPQQPTRQQQKDVESLVGGACMHTLTHACADMIQVELGKCFVNMSRAHFVHPAGRYVDAHLPVCGVCGALPRDCQVRKQHLACEMPCCV